MSFLGGLFKKKPGGTFFGNLLRGVAKNIPIVGGSLGNGGAMLAVGGEGKTNAELTGMSVKNYNASVGGGIVPTPIADNITAQEPTASNLMNNSNTGFPNQSQVFPTGQANNPTILNDVGVSASRVLQNTDFSLDWKNGRINASSNNGSNDNKMLLYGLLGLGAIMLINKK